MNRPKKIALGADHGGFDLKARLALHLQKSGYSVEDVGTLSREAVDYPVFARAVAMAVSEGRADVGIMIDGAGIGSCMVANKVPNVQTINWVKVEVENAVVFLRVGSKFWTLEPVRVV